MASYFLRRIGQSLVAFFGVMTLIFFIQRLTGDPIYLLVPETATQADIEALRHALGLDRPQLTQYLDFLWHMMRFDLGTSLVQNAPVSMIIGSRIPYTLELALGALVIAVAIGIPAGLALALARNNRWTSGLVGLVLAAQSMPTFWSGILLIMLFGVGLGWLPPSGAGSLYHLVMPSIALGLLSMATYARIMRSSVLDELNRDYVRSARARGVRMPRLVLRHLLRNSAIPVISITALEISQLLAGAVIVETVFAWPGLGQLTVQSVLSRDFAVVQGIVMLGAFVTILLNLLADLLYSLVDPRIRMDGASR
nr:ABC transporter permease [uncultured Cohaesibacter sp.]